MHNFCTLFDVNYLTRGLAMYESLQRHTDKFHLYILAFDDITFEILNKMCLPKVTLITLQEFEDERLLAVKPTRTRVEYCWTCTSHVIRYALIKYSLSQITYVDADLYFFNDPTVLLQEFMNSKDSVLITEHRYTPKYDRSATSGVYCVQFVTFNADKRGEEVLNWWCERCLEWCYARHEDGKFGDQKYLDDWPERFKGIHVLNNIGAGVAPWNVQQYSINEHGDKVNINGNDLIFYHYHFFKCYTNGEYDLGLYDIPQQAIKLIYRPYIKTLLNLKQQVRQVDANFNYGEIKKYKDWTYLFRFINRKIRGYYHVIR